MGTNRLKVYSTLRVRPKVLRMARPSPRCPDAVLHMLLPEDDINRSFVYNRVAPLSWSDLLDLEDVSSLTKLPCRGFGRSPGRSSVPELPPF